MDFRRGAFYKGHGDYDVRDYKYALTNGRIPEGYKVFWGYEDEKLFQFAREDLLEMAERPALQSHDADG